MGLGECGGGKMRVTQGNEGERDPMGFNLENE